MARFELFNDGVVARETAHTVVLAPSPSDAVPVDILTPDGHRLKSRVLGLSYYSPATGQSVMIAETKAAQGNQRQWNEFFGYMIFDDTPAIPGPEVRLRFAHLAQVAAAYPVYHITTPYSGTMSVTLRDSEFRGGAMQLYSGSGLTVGVTNCLFGGGSSSLQADSPSIETAQSVGASWLNRCTIPDRCRRTPMQMSVSSK